MTITKQGWYMICPDCGAGFFLSRWISYPVSDAEHALAEAQQECERHLTKAFSAEGNAVYWQRTAKESTRNLGKENQELRLSIAQYHDAYTALQQAALEFLDKHPHDCPGTLECGYENRLRALLAEGK